MREAAQVAERHGDQDAERVGREEAALMRQLFRESERASADAVRAASAKEARRLRLASRGGESIQSIASLIGDGWAAHASGEAGTALAIAIESRTALTVYAGEAPAKTRGHSEARNLRHDADWLVMEASWSLNEISEN